MMKKNSITTSTTNTTNNNSNNSNCVTPEGSSTRKKQYKGVRMRSWGSWVSEIRAPNQKTRIWLGSYSTAEAAARAYDAALVCLKGPMAALNFPGSPSHYHLPPNLMSPKAIQAIAAAAANDVPTTTTTTTTTTTSSSPSSETIEDDMFTVCSGSGVSDVMEEEMAMEMPIDFGFFESPKCIEQMLDYWTVFEAPQADDCDYYEGDINLWSFC